MSTDIYVFERLEKKYKLTYEQKYKLLEKIEARLCPDCHGGSTVCSLYLDTPDHLLIRNSIDAKVYKEKIRLRSYGTPVGESQVFLELKKKYRGVVYKRRASMTLNQAEDYIHKGKKPFESQIISEIDYAMKFYKYPKPSMLIAYEREAFSVKGFPNLRLTFDCNVRYRNDRLDIRLGTAGNRILPANISLLEIKSDRTMPVWLAEALDECGIFPSSFSKYGTSYKSMLAYNAGTNCKGGLKHVCNF